MSGPTSMGLDTSRALGLSYHWPGEAWIAMAVRLSALWAKAERGRTKRSKKGTTAIVGLNERLGAPLWAL